MRKLIFENIWSLDLNHEFYWKGKFGVYFSLSETIIRYKNKFNDDFHIFEKEKKKRLFWNSKTSYKNDNWRFYEEYCPNQKILLGENSFANFPCKTVVFRASTRIFQQVIIAWIWFLILVKPEVTYFWKMKISKKGRGRNYLKWRGDYMKKYEFHLRSWY